MSITTRTALYGGPVMPRAGELRPFGLDEIVVTGGFWRDVQRQTREAIIGHCDEWMERIGWTSNFDRVAAGTVGHDHSGIEFVDSEIYKLLEAMAWQLGTDEDAELAARYRLLVDRVARAQDPDGYLHTSFGHDGQRARYSDLEWGHELYCFGHLIQAAVARLRTGFDDELPAVARRLADHLWREFGPDGRVAVCGHPEVEMALAEFARAVGDERYLDLARLFVERRGTGTLGPIRFGAEYFQDDTPIRSATVLRGHAVRALYLASGAVDVAIETDDAELLDAVRRQQQVARARRTYITGGVGAHHSDEAFGADFELPPDRAYAETCAAIASVMLDWRLLLAGGADGAAHGDGIERALLNNVLASPRADGRAFFYTNTLHQRTRGTEPDETIAVERAESSLRAPWFSVSCCPTNVARTLSSAQLYFAAADTRGVQLYQYGDYRIDTELDGRRIVLDVASGYPYDGEVRVRFGTSTGDGFRLSLRVPAWATDASIVVDGVESAAAPGLLRLERAFEEGDVVELRLPMAPRITTPDPRIDAVRGQIAVERGPLVLCLESTDLPDGLEVDDVLIEADAPVAATRDGATATLRRRVRDRDPEWPYGPDADDAELGAPLSVPLRPYARWANRGPSTMRVWIPAVAAG